MSEMKKTHSFRIWIAAFLAALLCGSTAASAQNLNVNFDFSTFRYDTSRTYMELYYSFALANLKLSKEDSLFSDTLLFHIGMTAIGSDSGNFGQSWAIPVAAHDTSSKDLTHAFVGQIGLAVRPGNYIMRLTAIDGNDTVHVDTVSGRVLIPKYSFKKLETSDVELCSKITQPPPGKHSIFYKNTYDVVPNPKGVFGAGLPIIYYYVEVYNIPDSPGDSLFTIGYQVRDSYGQVKKNETITRKKFGDTSVEVGTVNGSNLKTGAYTFVFTVADSAAKQYATITRKFFVYNPGLGPPENAGTNLSGSSMLGTVFATMGMEQIDKEFSEASYIATTREKQEFKQLQSLAAKRQFLYDFWQKRNTDPVLNSNKYRLEYLKRVAYANDHFTVGGMPGWRSDRGRVYIIYGPPDQIDRHPNQSNAKPYQIWYYNSIQGGVSFDFIDRTGFGEYTLVNSTARNEIHNDNWQQYLTTG